MFGEKWQHETETIRKGQVRGAEKALYELHMLYPSSYTIEFGAADAWREGHCPDHWVVAIHEIGLANESAYGFSEKSLTDAIKKAIASAKEKDETRQA